MKEWWPPHVQQQEQRLYHESKVDTFIFRHRKDGIYIAVGGLDPQGVETLLLVADIVKYTSQRLQEIKYNQVRGYYR